MAFAGRGGSSPLQRIWARLCRALLFSTMHAVRERWSRFLSAVGLTRGGRILFTVGALLGLALVVADAVIPRPAPESDLGPNVAGVVALFVLLLLLGIVVVDAAVRSVRQGFGRSRHR